MSLDSFVTVSRRAFLRAGALALVSFGLDPLFLDRAAFALAPPPGKRRVLVCIFQRGAVDGLSMVVPHADAAYYRERPRIAIPQDQVLDLDGHFGLHPALSGLMPLWRQGLLAPVQAVGSPDLTRSHFDAQDYMESGTPGVKSTPDGWLNRCAAHDEEHRRTPFQSVAFGPQLPRILAGSAPALAISDLRAFGIRVGQPAVRDRLTRAFEELYEQSATGIVASSAAEGFEAAQALQKLNPGDYQPEHGAQYPNGKLGRSLMQIAQLIKADLGLENAFADAGGWDTHIAQGAGEGQLASRLRELGDSLAAFAQDLGDRMSDVVVLTMSEFGRTIAENGSIGTDHGHATAMFVLGGGVRGGRVAGKWPGLEAAQRFEGRDLALTTDFRDLFGEILTRHSGVADLAAIFPGYDPSPARFPGVMS
ncbi:MAG TPA: DUF1501 domain-containing protein [Candidatus Sulfotelmatobacter sp.]|nr:DUF1501 domain-containing protein [Candidatus Sulfotelmatobacter sp.]